MVEGAQLQNSFVILLSLMNSNEPLTTNQISGIISKKCPGEIYKNPGTKKDALDKRLVREAFVSSNIIEKRTKYSITHKGEKVFK
jgi:DNA-binding PadR family transcriptional regulator